MIDRLGLQRLQNCLKTAEKVSEGKKQSKDNMHVVDLMSGEKLRQLSLKCVMPVPVEDTSKELTDA